jgi:hypothetical protein
MRMRRVISTLLASMLVAGTASLLAGAGIASASPGAPGRFTCAGTPKAPGVLTGTYSSVTVRGLCEVSAGAAYVQGSVVVSPHGALVAAFARHNSNLTVGGSLTVLKGATLILGCEAAHFACVDDPNQKSPTLSSSSSVAGNLLARDALGVLVHASTIGASVVQSGGGGGRNCTPSGIFAAFKSPVYSDYEDNFVGGDLSVTGLRSCWFGALRDNVRGSALVAGNKMADPDAMEVHTNRIRGDIACFRNSPAIQYGDAAAGTPNVVRRHAYGQCGFNVLQPNPAATKTTPAGPLTPISVHARRHQHH